MSSIERGERATTKPMIALEDVSIEVDLMGIGKGDEQWSWVAECLSKISLYCVLGGEI
jgi:hypothetical protein